MNRIIVTIVVVTCFLLSGSIPWANECPEIDKSLQLEVEKDFPQYIIPQQANDLCSHIVELTPSIIVVLLKNKQSDLYMLIQAELSSSGISEKWVVLEVEAFTNEIPMLEKARAGFYTDVVTGKKVTITRHSAALLAILSSSGKQYIYKKRKDEGFDRLQIK